MSQHPWPRRARHSALFSLRAASRKRTSKGLATQSFLSSIARPRQTGYWREQGWLFLSIPRDAECFRGPPATIPKFRLELICQMLAGCARSGRESHGTGEGYKAFVRGQEKQVPQEKGERRKGS